MAQENQARRAAIRAYMAEHDVSYTTALRYFEARDRSAETTQIVLDPDFYDELISPAPQDMLKVMWVDGPEKLGDDEPTPVPGWVDLELLSGQDRDDATLWLRRGWATMDHLPKAWALPTGARGKFLGTATPVGITLTTAPDLGRPHAVVFFRGGGGLIVPAYIVGALVGIPNAGPKAAGYVKTWMPRKIDATEEGLRAEVRARWDSENLAKERALANIYRYHPSMETPPDTVPVDLGLAEPDLPWLHLSALPGSERSDLEEYLAELNPADGWAAPQAKGESIRDTFLRRGADSSDVFYCGEGADPFMFGVIKFAGEGALVVPAALAARTSLLHLPEEYAVKARRYGEETMSSVDEGIFMRRLGLARIAPEISRQEMVRRPPTNEAFFRLFTFAPLRRKRLTSGSDTTT